MLGQGPIMMGGTLMFMSAFQLYLAWQGMDSCLFFGNWERRTFDDGNCGDWTEDERTWVMTSKPQFLSAIICFSFALIVFALHEPDLSGGD